MGAIHKYLDSESELKKLEKENSELRNLLKEYLTLGQRWTYNSMNKTAQREYLNLFGRTKDVLGF